MEENNRKGPGIFYAVTGVATLVVAIIGATFAFFSANANDATTIQGNVAEAGGLFLKVKPLLTVSGADEDGPQGYTKNLIPLNVNVSETETEAPYNVSQFESALAGSCVDKNGNQVCQVYAVMIANMSTTSTIEVRGSLSLESEADNLTWKLIDVPQEANAFTYDATSKTASDNVAYNATDADEVAYALDHTVGTGGVALGNITVGGNSGGSGTDIASMRLTPAANTAVYYIMVWLEEIGTPQETPDAAKDYVGTVSFSAVDANGKQTGITAVF